LFNSIIDLFLKDSYLQLRLDDYFLVTTIYNYNAIM